MAWAMSLALGMSTKPLLIMAAGGTGGHMFPAQALSEELLRRGWRVKLSTDARGKRYVGGYSHAVKVEEVSAGTFARGGLIGKVQVPVSILKGVLQARRAMTRDMPSLVVGFGGYPSLPAMIAAGSLGVPRLIHEQNGVMGKVNHFLAKRVGTVACGTWPTQLPAGVDGVDIGNPIRAQVIEQLGVPYGATLKGRIDVLVIGGSQGAKVLSDVVPAAMALLPNVLKSRIYVAQQARPEDKDACLKAYVDAGVSAEVAPFFADAPERMARARLVISRAGASSVADISAIGRPSILIPYAAAAADHQTANARTLADVGAARMISEGKLRPDVLSKEIRDILENTTRAKEMAGMAALRGRPKAASHLADLVEAQAGEKV